MFWPLVKHALEVASVNFVVYTGMDFSLYESINLMSHVLSYSSYYTTFIHIIDRRKHEVQRCRDLNSYKGYFGIFLLFIIDLLQFWLSTSILLSWFMRSKYFFPTPNIPIRPAQLLTPKGGDAGALGQYGINVGPMLIGWLFRFLNGKVEAFIGRAMADVIKRQKKKEKDLLKQMRKEERAREKEARREERRQAKKAKEERMARRKEAGDDSSSDDDDSVGDQSYCGMTASNVIRSSVGMNNDTPVESWSSNFDDLD